jgi:formylmethanofuran dehydrogenase subunit E
MSQKTGTKQGRKRREKIKGDKKPNRKRRKHNQTLRKKRKAANKKIFFDKKAIKEEEPNLLADQGSKRCSFC